MYYGDIITNICARCNDPLKDRLEQRAKDHFIDAIYTIIDSGNYITDDIPAYYKVDTSVDLSSDYDLTTNNIYKVLEVFPDPTVTLTGTSSKARFTIKTITQIKQIANNIEMQPSAEDIFVYRIGNTLYEIGLTTNGYSGVIYMTYIQNINDDDWEDSTDLSNSFSNKLLRKAIGIAAVGLLKEDSL